MSRFVRRVRFLLRALLALGMLAGYYTLSFVVAAGSLVAVAWLVRYHAPPIAYLVLLALAGLSLWTAGRVLFARPKGRRKEGDDALPGIALDAADEPALFDFVADVARQVGTRPPDEIRLIADANASVTEVGGTLGFGRRRVLALGYLVLRKSNRSELVATIAHELGHFVAGDTLLGPVVHRAHDVLVRSVGLLEDSGDDDFESIRVARSILTAALTAYAKVALRVSLGVARQHELEADRVAIHVAGRAAHGRSLTRLHADGFLFGAYMAREIGPLDHEGYWPNAFWDGYDTFAATSPREEIERELLRIEKSPYDTHPSLDERIRFAEGVHGTEPVEDTRAALGLLSDPHEPWARLEGLVSARLRRCDWSDVAHIRGKRVFKLASETHRAYGALLIGGSWGQAAKGALHCLAAEGPYRLVTVVESELLQVNGPVWQALAPAVLELSLGSVVAMALVEEHGGRFVHELGRPLAVEVGGERVRPFELAEAAFTSPDAHAEMVRWLDTPPREPSVDAQA